MKQKRSQPHDSRNNGLKEVDAVMFNKSTITNGRKTILRRMVSDAINASPETLIPKADS